MKEKNLLASVALFSNLYNNEKYNGIPDVIAEYIKGAIVYENKYYLTSNEINTLLEQIFEFRIPESVIRYTVKNRLKGLYEKKDGYYYFDSNVSEGFKQLDENFRRISETHNNIFDDLVAFVKSELKISQKNIILDLDNLFEDFNRYLLGEGSSEDYSKFISAFVIKNQLNKDFIRSLNSIKEGIILYQGIKYTPDFNDLGKWTTELTIFLNTELLFSALGYNGTLCEEIFNDFYSLTREINSLSLNKDKKKLIELKYFNETADEINNFFLTAELIKNGKARLDPFKTAMKKITDECKNPAEVKAMCINFFSELKKMGIHQFNYKVNLNKLSDYNVEDTELIRSLKKQAEGSRKPFDEKECILYLQIFTKINSLRRGNSKGPIENIRYIMASENSFVRYLAHNNKVKFEDDDIPFVKDLDYFTAKFWFKLKKGFSDKSTLPKSFDVVTRARLIISSLISNTLTDEYENIILQNKDGILTKDEALERSFALREKQIKPEDLSPENISNSLVLLLDDDYLDTLYREKEKKEELLRRTLKEKNNLIEELEKYKERDRQIKINENKEKYKNERESAVKKRWEEIKKKNWKDLRLLSIVFVINFSIAAITLVLKSVKSLNNWLSEIGYYQLFIWITFAAIITIEIIGRSYLFNREKVKNGWVWLKTILRRNIYLSYKAGILEILNIEYEKDNPPKF